ncbi:MAG: KdsC family phosphatase [Intestinibacter sp.]
MKAKIRFLVLDVDGTLTDGKIYMAESGELFKTFDIKDGYGICNILPELNIEPLIITGRQSEILIRRCEELNITEVHQGVHDKIYLLRKLIFEKSKADNEKYTFENVAYCGDDLNDLSCMIEVKKNGGVVGCPRNAVREIKETADFVANNKGGNGAVREFIDFLRYNDRLVENEKYSKDRSKV